MMKASAKASIPMVFQLKALISEAGRKTIYATGMILCSITLAAPLKMLSGYRAKFSDNSDAVCAKSSAFPAWKVNEW